MKSHLFSITLILATVLALSACGVALAEDVTPPPGSTLPTLAPATETAPGQQATPEKITADPTDSTMLVITQEMDQATSPAATVSVTADTPIFLSFAGKITTPDGKPVVGEPQVELQVYDANQQLVDSRTTTADINGSFLFDNVESRQGQVYVAAVIYYGVTFYSQFIHNAELSAYKPIDVSIQVAEISTDTSGITAERLHIFLDFSQPGMVQVAELFIINNPSGKIVTAAKEGGAVLFFDLPHGATDLQFQDGELGERYLQTANGFGDTRAIAPGDGQQVLFGYNLAYQNGMTISLPLPLFVNAVVVMLPEGSISVQSAQLADAGEREVDNSTIHLYMGADLSAGSSLELTFSGQQTGSESSGESSIPEVWIIALAVLGAGAIGVGVFLLLRKRPAWQDENESLEPEQEETIDELLDAILALDDQYQAGALAQDAYDQRRAELKQRIKDLRDSE